MLAIKKKKDQKQILGKQKKILGKFKKRRLDVKKSLKKCRLIDKKKQNINLEEEGERRLLEEKKQRGSKRADSQGTEDDFKRS